MEEEEKEEYEEKDDETYFTLVVRGNLGQLRIVMELPIHWIAVNYQHRGPRIAEYCQGGNIG